MTLRDEGFAGRPEACAFNADHWEVVFGWLANYAHEQASLGNRHQRRTAAADIGSRVTTPQKGGDGNA